MRWVAVIPPGKQYAVVEAHLSVEPLGVFDPCLMLRGLVTRFALGGRGWKSKSSSSLSWPSSPSTRPILPPRGRRDRSRRNRLGGACGWGRGGWRRRGGEGRGGRRTTKFIPQRRIDMTACALTSKCRRSRQRLYRQRGSRRRGRITAHILPKLRRTPCHSVSLHVTVGAGFLPAISGG